MIKPVVLESDKPHGPWLCRGCDIWDAIRASANGDAAGLARLLERDPNLYRAEYWYTQPIRFAVREGHIEAVSILLDAGADPSFVGMSGEDLVTLARDRGHEAVARLLETARADRGRVATADGPADHPIHEEAAAGDTARVGFLLDDDPQLVHCIDRAGGTPLHRAVAASARDVVTLLLNRGADILLEKGADPNWPEGSTAPKGVALHAAARAGDRAVVELLLAHGADPDGFIDSSGSATYVARTSELRALLLGAGGSLNTYDLMWLGEDDEVIRRVSADPRTANAGCGGVLAAACTQGKRDVLVRLLEAGARVPPVLTECRSYLLSDPAMLSLLLDSGMDPDLPNWLLARPLHDLCGRDGRGRP